MSPLKKGRRLNRRLSFVKKTSVLTLRASRLHLWAAFKNLAEDVASHLFARFNAVNVQNGRRDVERRYLPALQLYALPDARTHGGEGARDVVAIGVIMLGDDRRGGRRQAVRMVPMLIAKSAQRL